MALAWHRNFESWSCLRLGQSCGFQAELGQTALFKSNHKVLCHTSELVSAMCHDECVVCKVMTPMCTLASQLPGPANPVRFGCVTHVTCYRNHNATAIAVLAISGKIARHYTAISVAHYDSGTWTPHRWDHSGLSTLLLAGGCWPTRKCWHCYSVGPLRIIGITIRRQLWAHP